jgi:hypothetical protein
MSKSLNIRFALVHFGHGQTSMTAAGRNAGIRQFDMAR